MQPRSNVHMTASELIELGMCPFRDEIYDIGVDVPCPICGAFGDLESSRKCVDLEVENS